jgi:biopolymer transport protein ExbB
VTGGISEALSSTVLGLVVAIVTLLFANMFRSLCRRQIAAINAANGRLELFLRESNGDFSKS